MLAEIDERVATLTKEAKEHAPALLSRLYRALYRIRRVEEDVARIYPTDKIKSPSHLSLGQESVSVGICEALRKSDIVFATYRSHAAYLAKGGDINRMIAELYGKEDGAARGKSGSMHLIDMSAGMMGTSAIVGSTIPLAVGYALAERMKGKDTVVVVFFGDGAMEEGVFHESLNFAALKKVPVLFVCENNTYAIHTPLHMRVPKPNFRERVEAYQIPTRLVEDGDVLTLLKETEAAVSRIRAGGGPEFFEVMTMRWLEHVGPGDDLHLNYRTKAELDSWKAKDQVKRLASMLAPTERQRVEADVESEVAAAFEFAEKSQYPADHELYEHVFHD